MQVIRRDGITGKSYSSLQAAVKNMLSSVFRSEWARSDVWTEGAGCSHPCSARYHDVLRGAHSRMSIAPEEDPSPCWQRTGSRCCPHVHLRKRRPAQHQHTAAGTSHMCVTATALAAAWGALNAFRSRDYAARCVQLCFTVKSWRCMTSQPTCKLIAHFSRFRLCRMKGPFAPGRRHVSC